MNDMTIGKRHNYLYLLICAVFAALCGCEEKLPSTGTGNATLQIRLCAPDYGVELKSVSSDPNSPNLWTSWERAVDGRYIYRATALLLQGSRLVAHKDISLNGESKEAILDFEGNFTHGSYTLMVVANYSSFEAEDGTNGTKSYAGLSDFSNTMQGILQYKSIENFTETYGNSFMNYKISSSGGVCPRVPQPLTLVKEIELHPGTNTISGELLRTYSRIRITVENNSDEELRISTMDFSNIFTQSSAYIFNTQGFINERRAVDATSSDALTPFLGTTDAPLVISAKSSSVVFDAYILESQRVSETETYIYSFGLGYDDMNTYTLNNTTAINKRANISTGHYIIYSRGGSRYLRAGSNKVEAPANSLGTLAAGMTIPVEYVWTLDKTGLNANQYYIGTANGLESDQTSYYMNTPSSSSVGLDANRSVYFTVEERSSYLTFACSGGSSSYKYLYYNNNNLVGYNSRNSNNAQFLLYSVDAPSVSTVNVPVKTINTATGQAEDVEFINRNDFINAVVKVSYSKNQGHFSFEVSSWNTCGGDVEFN